MLGYGSRWRLGGTSSSCSTVLHPLPSQSWASPELHRPHRSQPRVKADVKGLPQLARPVPDFLWGDRVGSLGVDMESRRGNCGWEKCEPHSPYWGKGLGRATLLTHTHTHMHTYMRACAHPLQMKKCSCFGCGAKVSKADLDTGCVSLLTTALSLPSPAGGLPPLSQLTPIRT